QKVYTDLCDPRQRCFFCDHRAEKRFRSLDVDGKVVIDKKYPHRSAIGACPVFHTAQFSNHAFIRSEANRIAKEPRDCAEITAVRTASPGFDRKHVEAFPGFRLPFQKRPDNARELSNHVELVEWDRFPGDFGVVDEAGFHLMSV